ncbi:hypothetical protein J4Q44_G00213720 [Coregonus suidteri]|uniref:von Willebrand factor A domain containing 1 n=1 Tax=Coregonus suidteri TaxID=861788 RepID=A0AAN8LTV0_9TELE
MTQLLNCCEGDVLFLLDSSGSVSSYEYSRMLVFLSELLLPFSLGEDQVRVGLLQVGTQPRLEFGFDVHNTQTGLQGALGNTKPLRGNTNTEEALRMAKDWVLKPGGGRGGAQGRATQGSSVADGRGEAGRCDWTNGGAESGGRGRSGDLHGPRELPGAAAGGHPACGVTPVLCGHRRYEYHHRGPEGCHYCGGVVGGGAKGPGTSPSTSGGQYQRLTRPGDSSTARLTGLKPDTTYTATLTPESNLQVLNPRSVTFTTKPEVLSPAMVTVSDSGTNSVRVSWGPLQPESVQSFQVEYSALPGGKLHTATVGLGQNSTMLTNLQPDTQYLVTVSARHSYGRERAMSVKVCTEEVRPALADLQLTTVGSDSVQVDWKASVDGLRGYWITWEGQGGPRLYHRSALLLLPAPQLTVHAPDTPAPPPPECVCRLSTGRHAGRASAARPSFIQVRGRAALLF